MPCSRIEPRARARWTVKPAWQQVSLWETGESMEQAGTTFIPFLKTKWGLRSGQAPSRTGIAREPRAHIARECKFGHTHTPHSTSNVETDSDPDLKHDGAGMPFGNW